MTSDPLETPERVQAFMADLTFRDEPVAPRQYLEAAVTADLAARQGGGVLIPLADALRALASLGQLPHTA